MKLSVFSVLVLVSVLGWIAILVWFFGMGEVAAGVVLGIAALLAAGSFIGSWLLGRPGNE
jgi:hypothetical protein